jgi:hypothetical protein
MESSWLPASAKKKTAYGGYRLLNSLLGLPWTSSALSDYEDGRAPCQNT